MPEAPLTEPLDRPLAQKGGSNKKMLAALEAARGQVPTSRLSCDEGRVNAQDFETLERTVYRRALAAAARVAKGVGAPRS